ARRTKERSRVCPKARENDRARQPLHAMEGDANTQPQPSRQRLEPRAPVQCASGAHQDDRFCEAQERVWPLPIQQPEQWRLPPTLVEREGVVRPRARVARRSEVWGPRSCFCFVTTYETDESFQKDGFGSLLDFSLARFAASGRVVRHIARAQF